MLFEDLLPSIDNKTSALQNLYKTDMSVAALVPTSPKSKPRFYKARMPSSQPVVEACGLNLGAELRSVLKALQLTRSTSTSKA